MICFEGADGSGKTTQAQLLGYWCKKNNIPYISSREPGGSTIGELIRSCLSTFQDTVNSTRGDILLYTFLRHHHILETILPQQQEGKLVILDRYLFSTLVYQGQNNNSLREHILQLHKVFNYNLFPKLTLFFNLEPHIAISRIKARKNNSDTLNFYDNKELDFHIKISQEYIQLYSYLIKRVDKDIHFTNMVSPTSDHILSMIDASKDVLTIHQTIVDYVNRVFNHNLNPLTQQELDSCLHMDTFCN